MTYDPSVLPASVHGTAVSFGGYGALLIGPSGAGKSATALQLLALGAGLVADDRVELFIEGRHVKLRKPDALPDLIEARGMGLLPVTTAGAATLGVVVDMGRLSLTRHPEPQSISFLGIDVPKIDKVDASHFPAAILLYLKGCSQTT